MRTSRREFLAGAAAAPLVFGLPFAGCSPAPAPPWLGEALAKLRAEGRLGLALRVPADAAGRCRLGHHFARCLDSDLPELREALADVVVLCFDEPAFRSRFGASRAWEAAVLIDGDGYELGSLPELSADPGALADALRTLIDGPDGARGRARAEAARRRATPQALARLRQLESAEDVQALAAEVGPILPLVVAERLASDRNDRQGRMLHAVAAHYEALPGTERGPRLPYGIELSPGARGGCGHCGCSEAPVPKALPACGIAVMPRQARSFVKFLRT
jgi:hypothetical protein